MLEYSVKKRVWKVDERPDPTLVKNIAESLKILEPTAALIVSKGFDTPEKAYGFLKNHSIDFGDPYELPDMRAAVKRIREALEKREKIVVFGDYDVDGVTSTTILYDYLKINSADVSYYIPNRMAEGYGVNRAALKRLADEGKTLMITVDNGTTAVEQINEAKSFGLDTVVTDHHECREVLPDCPVVNPKRPDCAFGFRELAGVGVTFMLIVALEAELRMTTLENARKFAMRRFCELVAIGTVADVMPLVGVNRDIVYYGLRLMRETKNPGLRALMIASGVAETDENGENFHPKSTLTATSVAFTIAPRINAAGRLDDAKIAVELFLTEDNRRAWEIASKLCQMNSARQTEEDAIVTAALSEVEKQCRPTDRVIVIAGEGWHGGVIGIVSSRVTEKFGLPSIIVTFPDDSEASVGKGSGRSVHGFNLVKSLEECAGTLEGFGGHEMAAGLTVRRDRLEDFRRAINDSVARQFGDGWIEQVVRADYELRPSEITLEQAKQLRLLEPMGTGNPTPVFYTKNLTLSDKRTTTGGRHTQLRFSSPERSEPISAIWFGKTADSITQEIGERVEILYTLEANSFNGRERAQIRPYDIRSAK